MNEDDDKQGILGRMFGAWNRVRENPVADIGLGFTPAGVVADVQDIGRSIRDRDPVGLGLASMGFIPVGGDAAKVIARRILGRGSKESPEVAKRVLGALEADVLQGPSAASAVNLGSQNPLSRAANREIRATSAPLANLQNILSGRVQDLSPNAVAEAYASAARRGIPLDAESIARRRQELYPMQAFHGTKASTETERLANRLVNEPNMQLFGGIGKQGRTVADTYRMGGLGGGTVVPLAVNPGRVLDLDVGGRMWSDIPMEDVVRNLYEGGMEPDDIIDAILSSEMSTAGMAANIDDIAMDELENFVYRAPEPDFDPQFEAPQRLPTSMTTDEVAELAEMGGYDSTIIRDVQDQLFGSGIDVDESSPNYGTIKNMMTQRGSGDDIIIINRPAGRVRHESAVFDPEDTANRNIFASLAALLGGGAAARALSQNNREER